MTVSKAQFLENVKTLKERVERAAAACGRNSEEIKILPVTKFHPLDAAKMAFEAGFSAVGENRVQEAAGKIATADFKINWELIGHLQTNKASKATELFDRIQSVDSIKMLQKIDAKASELGKTMRILLQINAGNDPAKFGVEPECASELLATALSLKNLKVEGLMTIAPLDATLNAATKCFENLRNIRDNLAQEYQCQLPELSMGMSDDLERAIAEGSTMIRVGTFLFGSRQ